MDSLQYSMEAFNADFDDAKTTKSWQYEKTWWRTTIKDSLLALDLS